MLPIKKYRKSDFPSREVVNHRLSNVQGLGNGQAGTRNRAAFQGYRGRPGSEDSVFVLKRHKAYVVDLRGILSAAMGFNRSLANVC